MRATDLATLRPSETVQTKLDRVTGDNGEKLHLTITRTGSSAMGEKVLIFSASSTEVWTDSLFVGQ